MFCAANMRSLHLRSDGWTLKQVALQRTKQRILCLVWSRALAHELVFALEDGSLHLLRSRVETVDSPAASSWEAAQVRIIWSTGNVGRGRRLCMPLAVLHMLLAN
jgi:hypothetical protein